MKSIKEKANEYGLFNPNIHYDADGSTYDDVDKPSMDFEAGANYVLDEIEKCVKSSSNSRLKIDTIKQIIKQLKK